MMKSKFCEFAGGKNISVGPIYEMFSKRNARGQRIETCLVRGCGYFPLTWKGLQGKIWAPPSFISIHASFPWSFSCFPLCLDKGLTLGLIVSPSLHAALRFSGQRATWPRAMWVYLTGDAVCHPIPLGPDQLRPQWSCSFPASRVKYGRPCHGSCAHKTYFQDEWKWSPFFLLYPFLFVSSASLFLIFFLIISLNFSYSLLYLTYIYVHWNDQGTHREENTP